MKRTFVCSLCHKGILGGALYLDDNTLVYRTNKLTVDQKFRQLVLPLREIQNLTWEQIVFPVATFQMRNGEQYRFLIYNKARFQKSYEVCQP